MDPVKDSVIENPTLSILMPVYNEENTVTEIIERIDRVNLEEMGVKKELVIVDDGSQDSSAVRITNMQKRHTYIKFIQHERNRGKGAAVRTAVKHATGDIVIIQDADLEYDPQDYRQCILPILQGKARVVYGSRFLSDDLVIRYRLNWLGTKLLNLAVLLLYFRVLTDEPTCYKTFEAGLLKNMRIDGDGFEWEPEITAKILKKGIRIHETPIRYNPRSYEEGKKLGWRDAFKAFAALIRYRFKKT